MTIVHRCGSILRLPAKEITFYADFGKRDGVTHTKKKQNLRTIFHGTQKKKKTVIAYAYVRYAGRNHSQKGGVKNQNMYDSAWRVPTDRYDM